MALNVLRSHLSAAAIGFFLLFIVAAGLLLPAVDTSWIYEEGGGFAAIDPDVLKQAGVAFGRVPSGYLAEGIRHLSEGRNLLALLEIFGLLFFSFLGFLSASFTGSSLQRHTATKPRLPRKKKSQDPFLVVSAPFFLLVLREAIDLWRNPKARLIAGVPFILAVLLRLFSARPLFAHYLGASADIILMGGLALYAVVMILTTFAHNAFAYDDHGLRLLFLSPIPLRSLLLAKNLVHAVAAVLLGISISIFYLLYLYRADFFSFSISVFAVFCMIFLGLAVGNFLSIYFPVKFHTSLQRRDKTSFASVLLGLGTMGIGALSLPVALLFAPSDGPGIISALASMGCAVIALTIYLVSVPISLVLLDRRKEKILHAVTRA